MKRIPPLLLIFFSLVLLTSSHAFAQENTVQWNKIAMEYYSFLKSPIGSTAIPLIDLLPKTDIPYSGSVEEQQAKSYIYENLLPLEARILKGDQQSIQLAFCLFAISGGDFTETLDIILGESIRPYPEKFISALSNSTYKPELGGLLGNCGEEFVDRQAARCKELKKRRSALQRVHCPQLQTVKQECVEELSQDITEECGQSS